MKKTISFSVVLIGFTAMASQIIFMREFLTVFYGNELSIGFILASWLIGGAIGSSALGRFTDKIKHRADVFSVCQVILAVLLPLSILAIRSVKIFLNITTGALVPFVPMAVSSFVILTPACVILGFMFSLACGMYEGPGAGAARIGKVYVLEGVGSIVGGILASFVLVRLLDPVQILGILSVLNILAALSLQCFSGRRALRIFLMALAGMMLVAAIAAWPLKGWEALREYSLKNQWKGYELIASRNSIYGNIAVARTAEEISFFDNGLHLYTVPDKLTAEEAVHFALLEDLSPENVLLIGGGVGGLVEEILKHPVKKADYVELDPLIIEMARLYLPVAYFEPLKDKRVSIVNMDGRAFVGTTKEKYDCVVIHLGDPSTAQINRYYTMEFFKEVKRILKDDGVISFAVSSSESYINREHGDFLRSIYLTMGLVFADVKIIPGETAYFLASPKKGLLTYDYKVLAERGAERKLDIKYVREYYLFSKLSPEKIGYTESAVKRENLVGINRDFRPIAYYYYAVFWMTRFGESVMENILRAVNEGLIWKAACGICVLIFLSGFFRRTRKSFRKETILAAVMAMGFSAITFQIVVLLAFQIIYGYLFYKLGFILTSFMIGLTLGGWWSVKIMPRLRDDMRAFIRMQGAVSFYPLVLPVIFLWLAGPKPVFLSWAGPNLLFPMVSVLAGFIGGFQFPLANKIYLGNEKAVGRTAGLSYGVDLLGSCLGAFVAGAFLIPVLGIPKTCLFVAIVNFTVLVLLIFAKIVKTLQ